MIDIDELYITNYCHAGCQPFHNICRLPKEEAFSLAYKMADAHLNTTAFYRFADFENYYPRRMATDAYLYDLFITLGGKPKEKHPLSFVLQKSTYLEKWFDHGAINTIKLNDIPSEAVSFTLGDSMSVIKIDDSRTVRKEGELTMYTKDMLRCVLAGYGGSIDDFMNDIVASCHYVEVQLWDDAYAQ